jgi:predicted Rossmann fold flavoprotein
MSSTVAVVGGGASGLLAAWRSALAGQRVILLEANAELGAKIRISGGGKCNVTHDGSIQQILSAFPKEQARFLRPALHAFSNASMRELLRRAGVETHVRNNGRVFPDSAGQVIEALQELVLGVQVEVRLGQRVMGLIGTAPRLEALVLADGRRVGADGFILACGGASYPHTGTRGEALGWLRSIGVPTRPWAPALAPVPLLQPHPEWEGTALRGGELLLSQGRTGRRLARFQEDVLFTRTGLSGPAVLELSRTIEEARRRGPAWLSYTLAVQADLAEALRLEQPRNPHLAAKTWLQRFLPERLCPAVLASLGLAPDQRLKDLTRGGRLALVGTVHAFPLGEPGEVSLARGEVSAGGVLLEAVDPRTLQVKGWGNLRVCGELLDLDGPVGGYNLQAAFSTGYLAGSVNPVPS